MNELVAVAGGAFLMGRGLSDAEILQLPRRRKVRDGLEFRLGKPEAWAPPLMIEVTVNPFLIGRYPVTQREWEAVTGANPSRFQDPDRPVESVTWRDTVAYCNARSALEGFTPCYDLSGPLPRCDFRANGYRLPTEAEWEYAARGAQRNQDCLFPGGNDVNAVAWHAGNAGNQTHRVGEKLPNELGLFDLAGNVWELCWDWYHPNYLPQTESPAGPDKPGPQGKRVAKGGCYKNSPHLLYTGRRVGRGMGLRNDHIGFRVVRTG